jgi:putative DNA primase/helicase
MDKLELELPAILRWALDGCMQWQAMGLAPPASVLAATDDYFSEQDVVGQWLEDCTHADPRAFTRASALFASWRAWCEERNLPARSTVRMMTALVERGFERAREPHTGQKGLAGIAIKSGG